MERSKIFLSVVIPAYNEEGRIAKTLSNVYSFLSKTYPQFEIVVVDDGSTDRTPSIVNDFARSNGKVHIIKNYLNIGKGYSVKRGMLASKGEIIIFSDADESVPISETERFVGSIRKGSDIAIASRALKSSQIIKRQAVWRQTMGKIFNFFVRFLTLPGIKDTQCGFKCFRREAALDIFSEQKLKGFAFDVEVLYLAQAKGYRISQLPVQWINSPKSKVDPLKDSLDMLKDLFVIKRLHRGRILRRKR
jgi:dolichyl-phosphate beta-glucosyltransferase